MSVTHDATFSGTSTASSTITVSNVTGGSGGTYLCWVNLRASTDTVSSVSGGGLTWNLIGAVQQSGRANHMLTLYMAQGTPSTNPFTVTVTVSDATGTRIAIVQRYSGVDTTTAYENFKRRNTNGDSGASSGGTDSSTSDITLSTSANVDSMAVVCHAPRGSTINASGRQAGYTERAGNINAGTAGELLRMYVFDNDAPSASEACSMPLSAAADWITAGLTLLPQATAASITSAGAIASSEAFGTPTVAGTGNIIGAGGIASSEAFGTPSLDVSTPLTYTANWDFWLCNTSDLSNVAPIEFARNREAKFRLNRAVTASFVIGCNDPIVSSLVPLQKSVKLYRNGILVDIGYIANIEHNFPDNTVKVNIVGWQDLFNYRYLMLPSPTSGSGVSINNGSFTSNASSWTLDPETVNGLALFGATMTTVGSGQSGNALAAQYDPNHHGSPDTYLIRGGYACWGSFGGTTFKVGRLYSLTFYVKNIYSSRAVDFSVSFGEHVNTTVQYEMKYAGGGTARTWKGPVADNSVSAGYSIAPETTPAWQQYRIDWAPSRDIAASSVYFRINNIAQIVVDTIALSSPSSVPRTQVVYTNTAASTIATNVINEMNGDYNIGSMVSWGPFGRSVVVTGSHTNRSRTYKRYENVGKILQELSDIESGYDYYIDPATGNLNIVASRGTNLSSTIGFGYNAYRDNLASVTRQYDGTTVANKVIVQGRYGTGLSTDGTSESNYGRMEDVVGLSQVTGTSILAAYATAETTVRANPRETVSIVPKAGMYPQPYSEYWLGDTVKLVVNNPDETNLVNKNIRIFGISISMDDNGNEAVTALEVAG